MSAGTSRVLPLLLQYEYRLWTVRHVSAFCRPVYTRANLRTVPPWLEEAATWMANGESRHDTRNVTVHIVTATTGNGGSPLLGCISFQVKPHPAPTVRNTAHITAILTFGWLFFPESPYWLVRQGKTTQAQNALRRVYGFKNDAFYNVEVRRMATENNQALALHRSLTQSTRRTFLGLDLSAEAECFNRMNRKRTLTAIFAASGQQMIGATFVIGYATYFLDLIGVKDYFDASIVLYVVMLLASMAAFPLTEIMGRRTMIVIPQFMLCCMLLLIGILGCVPDQGKASWGIIVLIYIWAIIYQLSIGAVGFVLASEIATVRLRSTTQGLVTITNAAWGLIMQFTIPYMVCSRLPYRI